MNSLIISLIFLPTISLFSNLKAKLSLYHITSPFSNKNIVGKCTLENAVDLTVSTLCIIFSILLEKLSFLLLSNIIYKRAAAYIRSSIFEIINISSIKNTNNNITKIVITILLFIKLNSISLKFSLLIYYAFLILYGSSFLKSNIISTKPTIPKILDDPIINKRITKSILIALGIPSFFLK